MNDIDLTEILKNCPVGTEFYHAVYDKVWFCCIDLNRNYPIRLSLSRKIFNNTGVTSKGSLNKDYNGECLLFPSKDQRDWSKFTAPWYKKERLDPKTLNPFDRVLVFTDYYGWCCDVFSHYERENQDEAITSGGCLYSKVIPYNDDTKHLVGTDDEAPEFYRYWEE